jgi:hypothetical protein
MTTKYSDPKYNVVTENYKEILLRVSEDILQKEAIDKLREKYGVMRGGQKVLDWGLVPQAERQALPKYKEPHWDEPNVFAHARIADVTDSQGRKGLFLNEIQSQWNLDYRKFQASMEKGVAIGQGFKVVPQHPAVTRWHEIILKRLLRYAAENGYDFITWATGEQVAGYYDLAKSIDEIKYVRHGENDKRRNNT